MGKWKFHVVLPNGDEYLTETLAEAKALEAKFGRLQHMPFRKHVEDDPPPVSNPVPAPTPRWPG